jgi:hypothetical protein
MDSLCKLHGIKPRSLDWTAGAKELYEAEVDRVFCETDERKKKLWSRTPLKIVRAGSVFATCRFAKVVERPDMEIAQSLMRLSDKAFKAGIDEAEKIRELSHSELRREIARCIADDFAGQVSAAEIRRSFRHNTKHKGAIKDAMDDMLESGMLECEWVKTGGRKKEVYKLKKLV